MIFLVIVFLLTMSLLSLSSDRCLSPFHSLWSIFISSYIGVVRVTRWRFWLIRHLGRMLEKRWRTRELKALLCMLGSYLWPYQWNWIPEIISVLYRVENRLNGKVLYRRSTIASDLPIPEDEISQSSSDYRSSTIDSEETDGTTNYLKTSTILEWEILEEWSEDNQQSSRHPLRF